MRSLPLKFRTENFEQSAFGQNHSLAAGAVLGDKVADDLLRVGPGIEISGIDEVAALRKGAKNL
jgi:hypothetical protein